MYKLVRRGEILRWEFSNEWAIKDLKVFYHPLPDLIKIVNQIGVPYIIQEFFDDISMDFHIDHLTNGYIDYSHLQIEEWHGENI